MSRMMALNGKALAFRWGLRLLIGLLSVDTALAQISGGVFRGEVRDASGALVPRAEIRIVARDSARETVARTNGEGLCVLREPALPAEERSIGRWFDKTAFAIPAPRAYGNAGRNLLRAPGSVGLDAAASRTFSAGERARLRLRGEFFNALNHANFGIPVHSTDSPAMATMTSAAPGRIIQLSARVEF